MKFLICLVISVIALAWGQETEPEGSAILSRCFYGELVNNEGNITEVPCDFSIGNACQTKIESKEEFTKVTRQCTQLRACENNRDGNNPKCSPGENGLRQCFSCCQEDLCNSEITIAEE